MDEARSLQYSIDVKANVEKAEQDIQNLIGQCGKLRAEVSGTLIISAGADTEEAEENIRELTENIGELQDEADTDIDIDVDTDQAADNIRDLTDDIGNLGDEADSIGSAFRKSFLAGVDGGKTFASSLRSGVGGALTYASDKVSDFKDDVVSRMKGVADNVVSSAKSIGHSFAHPIETIKSGLGGAIDSAKNKFTDFVRGADDAADAADDVGDAAAGAKPDVEGLGDAAEKSGSKFQKLGDIMKGIGKVAAVGLTAATVAVGGFAAASVNTGMAFDSSMSQVAATMGYSVAELGDATSEASQSFNQLREFAQEMGANTAFSASQAADALNYMALAGYDAETSMTMLPNVLNLAAAGGIELAAASDMVTDAQSALGLSLDETSELVDKMAAASSKSNTSVQQLGDAILTVGGTAKNLSGGTTELSMALGVLADNGIKGAEGGTALRNMILSLSAPTDKAAAQLKALGVEAFDAEGNLRPLNETFGDLNGALSGLTQEQQTQALNEIFNKVDLKSVNAMLGTSAERFDELSMAIDGAWVNMGSLSESLSDVGLDLTTMQGKLGKLGISEKAFSDILKTSGGNAETFAGALLEAADAGTSQADIISALGGNLEELQVAFDNTTGAAQAMADTQLDNLGIEAVTNVKPFEGGRNTETDAEFRERYYKSVDFAGGVNIDAIIAEIYESVEAVIAVTGEENDTDFESKSGLPPHSFEIVAYGGLDEEIAAAIFKRRAAGIQTFGNVTVPVIAVNGQTFDIRFSRPAPVNVWVKVFDLVTDQHFPLDGIEQIKRSLVAYIGGNTRGGLNIGQDVVRVALPTEVLKVPGVVDFKLQISADGETFGWGNVVVAARQKAVTEESMVSVS